MNLVQPGTVKTTRRQKLFEKLASQEGLTMELGLSKEALEASRPTLSGRYR